MKTTRFPCPRDGFGLQPVGSSAAANSFHDKAGALGCIAGAYLGFFFSPFGSYPDTAVIRASRGWDMHVLEWIVKHFHNALDPSVAAWHLMSKWPNINVDGVSSHKQGRHTMGAFEPLWTLVRVELGPARS